jgi:hypothetical protein
MPVETLVLRTHSPHPVQGLLYARKLLKPETLLSIGARDPREARRFSNRYLNPSNPPHEHGSLAMTR